VLQLRRHLLADQFQQSLAVPVKDDRHERKCSPGSMSSAAEEWPPLAAREISHFELESRWGRRILELPTAPHTRRHAGASARPGVVDPPGDLRLDRADVKPKQFLEWNGPTMALLDRTTLCRERWGEADGFVARQSLDLRLPSAPAVRRVELVQVAHQAPVHEVGVTLLSVLPPERVGREVPNAVTFGCEPPPVQGEEATYDVVRDKHRGWRAFRFDHPACEVPPGQRAREAGMPGAEQPDPAMVDEDAACVEDDRTEGRPRRGLYRDQRLAGRVGRAQDLDWVLGFGDPALNQRPGRILAFDELLERAPQVSHPQQSNRSADAEAQDLGGRRAFSSAFPARVGIVGPGTAVH
jgi:hypothetical protein